MNNLLDPKADIDESRLPPRREPEPFLGESVVGCVTLLGLCTCAWTLLYFGYRLIVDCVLQGGVR